MTNKVTEQDLKALVQGMTQSVTTTTFSNTVLDNSAAAIEASKYSYERENETPEDRRFISSLFDQLRAAFRAGFYELKGMEASEQVNHIKTMKRQWIDAFKRAEMNDTRLITYAINRMIDRGDKFIPVVGEFLALCEEGKIPAGTKSHAEAWKEIKGWLMLARDRRKPSDLSNEVFHTYNRELHDQMAFRERTNTPEQREAWQQAYTRTIERLKAGKTIAFAPPPNQMQLEKKPGKPANREFAASFLAEMKKGLS